MRWKEQEKGSEKPLKAQPQCISRNVAGVKKRGGGVRQGERDLGCCESLSKMTGSADQAVTMESWD